MATEIALLPLQNNLSEGIDLKKCEAFQDTIRTLEQQRGFQRVYWGLEKQDSDLLRFFVDWDSVEDHIAFTKTEGYSAFMDRLGEVVDLDRGQLFHINATPHPPLVLSEPVAPVTEIWSIYFPAKYPEADQLRFEEDIEKLFTAAGRQRTCKGSASGWVLENIDIPETDEKGKAFQAFIGWESFEAAWIFQQTAAFQETLALIEAAKDLMRITIVHYTGTLEDRDA